LRRLLPLLGGAIGFRERDVDVEFGHRDLDAKLIEAKRVVAGQGCRRPRVVGTGATGA